MKSGGMASRAKIVLQSAVIAYRRSKNGPRVLLITSRDTHRWVLPKGNVEDGMTPAQSAAKEAFEEAGVKGKVKKTRLGTYRYLKPDLSGSPSCRVDVFPMEVTKVYSDWPEKRERRRQWMSPAVAAKRVQEKGLKKIMLAFMSNDAGIA